MKKLLFSLTGCIIIAGCVSSPKQMNVAAPLPPYREAVAFSGAEVVPAAVHVGVAEAAPRDQSCKFTSFQRKNTLGYEIDPSRHVALTVSPSFNIWEAKDFETKVSLRFTKAFGGPANKRPKCTYGSGFYGLLPYAANEGIHLNGLFDGNNIKSFAEDKLKEREQRRKEREAEEATGI